MYITHALIGRKPSLDQATGLYYISGDRSLNHCISDRGGMTCVKNIVCTNYPCHVNCILAL